MSTIVLIKCIVIGSAMGLLSGLVGVGGGIIAVPCFMYFLGMSTSVAMGTSLAVIVPVAISGSIKHYMQDNVQLKYALLVAAGGIIFAYLGAMLNEALGTPEREVWLKRAFSIVMIIAGTRMMAKTFITSSPKAGQTQTSLTSAEASADAREMATPEEATTLERNAE